MLIIVKSGFYGTPKDPSDPPPSFDPSDRSRAIDIFAILNASAPPRISYQSVSGGLTTFLQLEIAAKRQLLYAPEVWQAGQEFKPLDRIYYENNWVSARHLLCRKYVKDVASDHIGDWDEDPALRNFERFLSKASERIDLGFIPKGVSASGGHWLASNDRLLYHFGFNWLSTLRDTVSNGDGAFMHLRYAEGGSYIVRRTTGVATIIRATSTDRLTLSPLCPNSWTSNNILDHRRTVILFNELYSPNDGLPFIKWISPDADTSTLWDHPADYENPRDTEVTAIFFVHKLAATIWQKVVDDLEDIIEECLKHIIYREQTDFYKQSVEDLELIAERTWRDMSKWHVIQKLIATQRESVSNTRAQLTQLVTFLDCPNTQPPVALPDDAFPQISESLMAFEKTFAEDFRSRGQSISDLVYNIINVRQAQAAQQESRDLGRISWITFIFFPLISISGIFGMNVDIFIVKPPSIAWYFIVSIPATVLVLTIAFLSNAFAKWRRRVRYGSEATTV